MISSASGLILSRPNSSIMRNRLRAPTSLQAVWAYKSPMVSLGVRTLARIILNSSWFGSPRSNNLVIGTRSPSS